MRVTLDACVLFPTVMRDMLLGAAGAGAFEPLWSARILEEWARAARRRADGTEAIARHEIVRLRADWPASEIAEDADLVETLSLPDADDRHVLATAIAGRADVLMTLNRRDFPSRTLARHGLVLREPDGFLTEFYAEGVDLASVIRAVQASPVGQGRPALALLKRAGLPRLSKALGRDGVND